MFKKISQVLAIALLTLSMIHSSDNYNIVTEEIKIVSPEKISSARVIEYKTLVKEEPEEFEIDLSEDEINLIASITMAEAEGESEKGKRLVISTILNRLESERFPDTVEDVVYQKNQFEVTTNGRLDKCYATEENVNFVKKELLSRSNYEVMFFTSGDYGRYGQPMFREGNHYFSSYD